MTERDEAASAAEYVKANHAEVERQWNEADGRTALQHARDTWNELSPKRRAQLNAEWE